MTETGELVVEQGDLAMSFGDESIASEVLFRLKTTKGDWTLSPAIGCSLEDYVGMPNDPITLASMEVRIYDQLVLGDLTVFPDVRCVALGDNTVLISIKFPSVEDERRDVQIQAGYDFRKGLVFSRTVYPTDL